MRAQATRARRDIPDQIPLELCSAATAPQMDAAARAIEDDAFPFEKLSEIAEAESWRKEIHRPPYYVHKWWARRLGSVFRAIILGCLAPTGSDILKMFYQPRRFPGATVFDPFMGSGVTLGEALKLGARVIGRDINPVAYFLVCNALGRHDRSRILQAYEGLERDVSPRLRRFYRAVGADGRESEVLYFFWVKGVSCPACACSVDLFSSRIFAQHANPQKHPRAQATCPFCGGVNEVRFDARHADCTTCNRHFDPSTGPARGAKAHCPACSHEFAIAKAVREKTSPPCHRLYAKLVMTNAGEKTYLPCDEFDQQLYLEAAQELQMVDNPYPVVGIQPGYNTNQVLGYNYTYWHQFFNARQLLCLKLLGDGIRRIDNTSERELMACLLSGALEFNNMFASFKGEGTGAVRHMFSHHILKPERTPLEANLWGTPASSGSFSGLFVSRILRALDYAENPTEIILTADRSRTRKIKGLSEPLGHDYVKTFSRFKAENSRLYLSCGNSARTDIDDETIDVIVTDPPFFDNVHYSQLADFFHVWQLHILGAESARFSSTTRTESEVQDESVVEFTSKLAAVLTECYRTLRPNGLLAFTYHHSRAEGWGAVLAALMRAGFRISATHPIKAEMSVAQPKTLAKEPIDLDIILVCRKRTLGMKIHNEEGLWNSVEKAARTQVDRLRERGRRLSRNDVRVVVMAHAARYLSSCASADSGLARLAAGADDAERLISRIHESWTGD